MENSKLHSHLDPVNVRPLMIKDCSNYEDLARLGISIDSKTIRDMMNLQGYGMDALTPTITPGTISTPIQFLQNWLPGVVMVVTAARNIDEFVGISTVGAWEDEEVVQTILERTGNATPYGDLTNVPLSSYNNSFERRTVIRFEEGMQVGSLEEARAARININSASSKREAAAEALEIERNAVGFYGYNNGDNRTYGFLNDPNLPNYVGVATVGGNTTWAQKTYLQIIGDIITAVAALRQKSQGRIDPKKVNLTLAVADEAVDYLAKVSDYGNSVMDWMKDTYPKMRVVSAPELTDANGGASVFYLYADRVGPDGSTDGNLTFIQPVPSRFQMLGVEKKAKGFLEDYSNATAGVFCKRPWAIVRYTGI